MQADFSDRCSILTSKKFFIFMCTLFANLIVFFFNDVSRVSQSLSTGGLSMTMDHYFAFELYHFLVDY